MYVIVAPIQIKEGHREAFIEAMLDDAKGSVRDEPDCLRFDVIQDGSRSQPDLALRDLRGRGSFPSPSASPSLHKVAGYGKGLVRRKLPKVQEGEVTIFGPPMMSGNSVIPTRLSYFPALRSEVR